MSTDQKVEMLWETPSLEDIVEITKAHVAAMETSDADEVWQQVGMHHILLCLLYTSPSPRDATLSRMPSSA